MSLSLGLNVGENLEQFIHDESELAWLTDNKEADGDGGRAEAVGRLARVPTGIGRLDVGHVQPRAAALHVESLPAEVDSVRVLRPRHQRPRMTVHWTGDAHGRSQLNDQRRRILRFYLRRLRSWIQNIPPSHQRIYTSQSSQNRPVR